MKFSFATLLAVLLLAANVCFGKDQIDYSYVDVLYLDTELEPADGDGFAVRGSYGFNENVHFLGEITFTDISAFGIDVDFNTWRLGAGFHGGFSERADFIAEVTYESAEVDAGFSSLDDSGFGVRLGARGLVTEKFEVNGYIRHVDIDDIDTMFGAGVLYHFNDVGALLFEYETGDDLTNIYIGGRISFSPGF